MYRSVYYIPSGTIIVKQAISSESRMNSERGRPRAFEHDKALDSAMEIFWKHGYQAASLADLTRAMNLNKPSLYAAFGNKEKLYLACLQRYQSNHLDSIAESLESEPSARIAIANYLNSFAELFINPKLPGGCFVVNGTADVALPSTPTQVIEALQGASSSLNSTLEARIARAVDDRQLSSNTCVNELTMLYVAVIGGMALLAHVGSDAQALKAVVSGAMSKWPESDHTKSNDT